MFKPMGPNPCANCIVAVGRFSKIDGFMSRCESRPTGVNESPVSSNLGYLLFSTQLMLSNRATETQQKKETEF